MDKSTQRVITKYPIFMISFQPGTDMRKVLQLHKLCHCIIRREKFKNSRPVRQCFNCQSFGHSSNFCGRPPKCVKCEQHHASKDCTKPASYPPKCVNCDGDHPPTTASGSQHEDKQPTIPISTVTVPRTQLLNLHHHTNKHELKLQPGRQPIPLINPSVRYLNL